MFIILRTIHETVMQVFLEFRNNKLRTFLSLMGVSIGIFCIITVLSAVDSLKRNIDSGVAKLGSDNLYIQRWPWIFSGEDYAWWEYIKRPTMKYEEYKLLNEKLLSAKAVAIETGFNSKEVKFEDNVIKNGQVNAVSEHFDKIYSMDFVHGRFFTQLESASGSPVAILGYNAYKTLFPDLRDPTGSMIWVLENKLKVVGVVAKEGQSIIDFSQDNNILITYNYVRRIMDMQFVDPIIEVKPLEGISARQIKDDIIPLLRNHRKLSPREENDFAINEVTLAADAFDAIFGVVNTVGFIIGFFSCLVGGFGIANIMFVSVKERTHVIGIKKSIGAKNYLILYEFLFESVVLSCIGCAIGLLLVWIMTILANNMIDFKFVLSFGNIMFGIVLASIIGIIAGIVPAITASRMDPVEAIRSKG